MCAATWRRGRCCSQQLSCICRSGPACEAACPPHTNWLCCFETGSLLSTAITTHPPSSPFVQKRKPKPLPDMRALAGTLEEVLAQQQGGQPGSSSTSKKKNAMGSSVKRLKPRTKIL